MPLTRVAPNRATHFFCGCEVRTAAEIVALDSIADLIASSTLAQLDAFRTESLDGSETTEIHEFDGVRKDGSIVRLKSMARPIDWQGRRAVVLTLLEITGHEKAEAAHDISSSS